MVLRTVCGPTFLVIALALGAVGCERVTVAASLGPGGFAGGRGQTADALVGRWIRTAGVPTAGGDGYLTGYLTETAWEFRADGTATRTVITRTAFGQAVALDRTRAAWRAGAGVLLLDLGPPSYRLLRVPFAIEYDIGGTLLYLDGEPYVRAVA